MADITLIKATKDDMHDIWQMQIDGFSGLLDKYRAYATSPGAESFEKVMARFEQPWTTYYYISAEGENVGAIRIVDNKDDSPKKISPIWIMPEYRNNGYASAAIKAAEDIHGANNWSLGTILQEPGNLHLYEKMGYHQTGTIININDKMDIVIFEKD
ncbi:hypothetical protein SAMN02910298_02559 [Pseudobutyrivibrio sp. YE44]|uniref:GNAT family N-acetyltransferase n=1 Tax=Pseudobutyrivibrio sp. YE44 TaxID=1520802 RepID=UPI00087E42E5|nr:GNAT family N-acetyltransferase [Pseudobutyrivibrio sp. YE44]SDB50541.1 hypothetical protein SAMN02910298_02559 [Pseudobutyrivibrio sp. YE44]